nr:MAG TPA: hypothetical protein [Herelleviridae sp.]
MKLVHERDKIIYCYNIILNLKTRHPLNLFELQKDKRTLLKLSDVVKVLGLKEYKRCEEQTDIDLLEFLGMKNVFYYDKYDIKTYFIDLNCIKLIEKYPKVNTYWVYLIYQKIIKLEKIKENSKYTGIDLKKKFYKYMRNNFKIYNNRGEEIISYDKYMKENDYIYRNGMRGGNIMNFTSYKLNEIIRNIKEKRLKELR